MKKHLPWRILLAEDNVVSQELAAGILRMLGHSVQCACTGQQAVLACQAGRFDLVIMDVQMPEMDGFEATAAIRRGERTTGLHVPIVALTAQTSRDDCERCLHAGMDGYVSKPVSARQLADVIRRFCPTRASTA